MKKLLITFILVLSVTCAMAAEKKPIKAVDPDALTNEIQVIAKGAGDDHTALVWWIPYEFWEITFARDETTSETDKKTILDTFSGVSLLSVVQADLSSLGAFTFYTREIIQKNMVITYTDTAGKKQRLFPLQATNPDLEILLGQFKPVLKAAMGNLGNNMHFYVLDDKSKSSLRLLDPYREGIITIQLIKKNNDLITAEIEMPLNCLFIPRICPNGKEAHISWKYCPWTGTRLND